jgi:hypothetical protein
MKLGHFRFKKEVTMSRQKLLGTWFVGLVVFLLWVSLTPAVVTAQVKPIAL